MRIDHVSSAAMINALLGAQPIRRAAGLGSAGAMRQVAGVEKGRIERTDGAVRNADGDSFTPSVPAPAPGSSAGSAKGVEGGPQSAGVDAAAAAHGLSEEERARVEELSKRDAEVRAHEQAHLAAAGGLARGGTNYTYETGPDGRRYAVSGEVRVDTSPVEGDPEATIAKAQRIKAAAMAPAEPSSKDRAVAAQASRMEAEARAELQKEKAASGEGSLARGGVDREHEEGEGDGRVGSTPTRAWAWHTGEGIDAQGRYALSAYESASGAAVRDGASVFSLVA